MSLTDTDKKLETRVTMLPMLHGLPVSSDQDPGLLVYEGVVIVPVREEGLLLLVAPRPTSGVSVFQIIPAVVQGLSPLYPSVSPTP